MIGTTEIVVIVVAGLVLFGATALPKFARSLGQAKKEFQKGIREAEEEAREEQAEEKSGHDPKASVSKKESRRAKSSSS